MRDNYDFSDAIKNPFSGREKGKFVVKIKYTYNIPDNSATQPTSQKSIRRSPSPRVARQVPRSQEPGESITR